MRNILLNFAIASLITNIVFETNYKFVRSQNGPTFHEHVT